MTDYTTVIGVDVGPIPGIVVLGFKDHRLIGPGVVQTSANLAPEIVSWMLDHTTRFRGGKIVVQAEKFVVGHRSARSSSAGAGQITRDLIGELRRVTAGQCPFVQHSAAMVKPWATDARLEAAGLLDATKGMRHARDGARHALYAACKYGGIPDPLGKRWSAA